MAASVIINLWSAPRCCSTALMYSFAQRSDTTVVDEPLYASWLAKHPECARPYREELLRASELDGRKVVASLLSSGPEGGVLFLKHIGKFIEDLEDTDLVTSSRCVHVFLVRNRVEKSLVSFGEGAKSTLLESSYPHLVQLYSRLRDLGRQALVVVSEDIVSRPRVMLARICQHAGLAMDPQQLSWEPGPKEYDGVWAKHWYRNVWASSGFEVSVGSHKKAMSIPDDQKALLEEVIPFWCFMKRRAVRAASLAGESSGPEGSVKGGTHEFHQDPRNARVLIGIRDGVSGDFSLVPRSCASVSVLDSGFLLGDGAWEGIRLHNGRLLFFREHVDRLYQAMKALDISMDVSKEEVREMVEATTTANGMVGGVHIRLIVSRGLKLTPYQSPAATVGWPTIVVIPEHKAASPEVKEKGIKLITSAFRRARPDTQDPAINCLSKNTCISACIHAVNSGYHECLMLDPQGFVATCNSTNFIMVKAGVVLSPTTDYQLHGITRQNMLDLAREAGYEVRERNFTLIEVYDADECFVTGTFAGAIPVVAVDGRVIGEGRRGEVTRELQQRYGELCDKQ